MWHVTILATASAFGYTTMLSPVGGAWYVFNDTQFNTSLAPLSCDNNTPAGTLVDDACCEILDPYFGTTLDVLFAASNCFASDALIADGTVVRPYLGCDDGLMTYGEECGVMGQPYPWPPGTNLTDLTIDAADYAECGCATVMQGPGCYKATDLNEGIFAEYAGPPYNDGRQFFVKLESCA